MITEERLARLEVDPEFVPSVYPTAEVAAATGISSPSLRRFISEGILTALLSERAHYWTLEQAYHAKIAVALRGQKVSIPRTREAMELLRAHPECFDAHHYLAVRRGKDGWARICPRTEVLKLQAEAPTVLIHLLPPAEDLLFKADTQMSPERRRELLSRTKLGQRILAEDEEGI